MDKRVKNCPYCGEEILENAIKCKHCQTWLKKKCPFCAEMIDTTVECCPYCDTKLDLQQSINTTSNKVPNKILEDENNESELKDISDSGWTIVWKLGLAIIGAIIFTTLFPHAFDDKIIVQNTVSGEKFEFPVDTININGNEEYCAKVSALEGSEHYFCSDNKDSLTKFITKVKELEMKIGAEMSFKGQDINKETTEHFSLDKMIYEMPKRQYSIYERNPNAEQEEIKIKKAVEVYHKEQVKENAEKFGVSKKCAEDYLNVLKYEGFVEGDVAKCSAKENQAIKNYWQKEEASNREYALDDVPEPIWTNGNMPKSLVLQGVPIMCFEKANLGDNSNCTHKQLETIKKYYSTNNYNDSESEYFEY